MGENRIGVDVMPRYIDADQFECIAYTGVPEGYSDTFDGGVLYMADLIDEAPTIDPESLRARGEWVMIDGMPHCSKCGLLPEHITNYCPNCGAKMEVSRDA